MNKTARYNGENHKVFVTRTPYGTYPLIVVRRQYGSGGMALEALVCDDIGDGYWEPYESFGVITVNLGSVPENHQYVKNYSENSVWAEELVKKIGGKDTGIREQTGFVTVPLYDFSEMKLTE